MIRPLIRVVFALVVLGLAGCTARHYKIVLRDGREIITASQPEFIPKTGYFRYQALSGKDALVRADEVLAMSEQ